MTSPGHASKSQIMDLLRSVPLFAACSKRELSLLAGIADQLEFDSGDVIFREGETDVGLQVILEGQTEVSIGDTARRKLGPGAFLGEIALLDGGPRSATVTALTPVKTLSIPAWTFNATLKGEPALALKMLRELARRIRESDTPTA
ncbi:MAG TPA: cyclic nucleotide-binding domain-containing protein [Actinomycetota bacterium]|nr:cyclic nucleotide-binding domain-containing protein [Actinomycetota bacterium]